jgi:hypothetical protein
LATHQAIAAVSLALKGLLDRALPKGEYPTAQIKLLQPVDFGTGMAEGISLLLYRVGVSTSLRNLPPRTTLSGQRFRPGLPVDLHYVLSAWASDADKQQRLLGWAMRLLEDTPVLAGNEINAFMPETAVFHADESIELICEPLPLDQWLALWDKLKPKVSTSMTYLVRMVQLDSERPMPDAERVRQRSFDLAKGPAS